MLFLKSVVCLFINKGGTVLAFSTACLVKNLDVVFVQTDFTGPNIDLTICDPCVGTVRVIIRRDTRYIFCNA